MCLPVDWRHFWLPTPLMSGSSTMGGCSTILCNLLPMPALAWIDAVCVQRTMKKRKGWRKQSVKISGNSDANGRIGIGLANLPSPPIRVCLGTGKRPSQSSAPSRTTIRSICERSAIRLTRFMLPFASWTLMVNGRPKPSTTLIARKAKPSLRVSGRLNFSFQLRGVWAARKDMPGKARRTVSEQTKRTRCIAS